MDPSLRRWQRTNKRTIPSSVSCTAANTSTTTSTKWRQNKQVSIHWKWQRLNVSGRARSLVARNYNRFKWTSAVYSSKAIGRWCSRSRRGLYGTEQAICNAPTGRRDARAARAGGVDGGGARAAAVARRQLRAHSPACSTQPWPRQHQCSDQHAQRANHSIWEQSQCSTHCEYLSFFFLPTTLHSLCTMA